MNSKFKPGQSGNPRGKPKGARNHATRTVLAMLDGSAEEITKAVLDAAKAGDLGAAKFVLERIAPPMRERPIEVDLPNIATIADCASAQAAVLASVAAGDLLPSEGDTLAGLIEQQRRSFETTDLAQRLEAIEAQLQQTRGKR